jgi:hypothetical protein
LSFNELAITITVENLASAEFNRVASDASSMGSSVGASAGGFEALKTSAEATTVSLRTVATAFGSIAHMGTAIISIAGDMGIVDKETAKWARTLMAVFTLVSAYIRLQHYMTVLTTGHTAAVAINTTAQSANASSSIAVSVAHKIKAAATWLAVSAQNALNVSHATFLALTGIGIGVIIAAAAAMAYFASQMNAATDSVKEYNEAVAETPTRTRSITRAGEEELYRRGVEP